MQLIKDLELFQMKIIPDSIHYLIIRQLISGLSDSKEDVDVRFYNIAKWHCSIELIINSKEYVDIEVSDKYIEYRGFGCEYIKFYDLENILVENSKLIDVFLKSKFY